MEDDAKSNTVFIANLNPNTTKEEVKLVFRRYGRILSIDLIRKRPENVYAFIEFDDMRDAVDAVLDANLTDLRGKRLRIQFRNGGYNEKRDTVYEPAKDNSLQGANGVAAENPRMETEEEAPVAKPVPEQPQSKPSIQQQAPRPAAPFISIADPIHKQKSPEKNRQPEKASQPQKDRQPDANLLTIVSDLQRTIRDLQGRVEALQRQRAPTLDSRYSNKR